MSNSGTHPIAVPPTHIESQILLALIAIALTASGVIAADHLTWFLEIVWILIALPLVVLNWSRFPLTRLLCWLLAAHASSPCASASARSSS